ncbi:MAG: hypothetical protein KIS78_10940, partial [Labilithrix sp.]|nr:hypothetical protein [Labilithrix sp.]
CDVLSACWTSPGDHAEDASLVVGKVMRRLGRHATSTKCAHVIDQLSGGCVASIGLVETA